MVSENPLRDGFICTNLQKLLQECKKSVQLQSFNSYEHQVKNSTINTGCIVTQPRLMKPSTSTSTELVPHQCYIAVVSYEKMNEHQNSQPKIKQKNLTANSNVQVVHQPWYVSSDTSSTEKENVFFQYIRYGDRGYSLTLNSKNSNQYAVLLSQTLKWNPK